MAPRQCERAFFKIGEGWAGQWQCFPRQRVTAIVLVLQLFYLSSVRYSLLPTCDDLLCFRNNQPLPTSKGTVLLLIIYLFSIILSMPGGITERSGDSYK